MATVWKLATFTVAGCAPFGVLVVNDQALALSAVATLLEQQGLHLRGRAAVRAPL